MDLVIDERRDEAEVERQDQDTVMICVSRAEPGCSRLRLDL